MNEMIDSLWSAENIATSTSIIVSSVVAIIILVINQVYSNRRERNKIICEKIEAFYEASINYANGCDQLITDIQTMKYKCETGYYRNDPIAYAQFENSITKMEMLHGLYFPDADFNREDYIIDKMPIIWAANSGEIARCSIDTNQTFLKSRQHIDTSSKHLRLICNELMRIHMV